VRDLVGTRVFRQLSEDQSHLERCRQSLADCCRSADGCGFSSLSVCDASFSSLTQAVPSYRRLPGPASHGLLMGSRIVARNAWVGPRILLSPGHQAFHDTKGSYRSRIGGSLYQDAEGEVRENASISIDWIPETTIALSLP
jgi:hypothetical protein